MNHALRIFEVKTNEYIFIVMETKSEKLRQPELFSLYSAKGILKSGSKLLRLSLMTSSICIHNTFVTKIKIFENPFLSFILCYWNIIQQLTSITLF